MRAIFYALVGILILLDISYASVYKGPNIPSDEMLMKCIKKPRHSAPQPSPFHGIAGKYRESDNVYYVFWLTIYNGDYISEKATLIKLDTNLWVMKYKEDQDFNLIEE